MNDEYHRGYRVGTKTWVDCFVAIMLSFDWVSRHDLYNRLYRRFPKGCQKICDVMSPDVMLYGRRTGKSIKTKKAIKLVDRRRPVSRQTTLPEFFG